MIIGDFASLLAALAVTGGVIVGLTTVKLLADVRNLETADFDELI